MGRTSSFPFPYATKGQGLSTSYRILTLEESSQIRPLLPGGMRP